MREWTWRFDPDANPPRSSIYISHDPDDFTAVMYTEPAYLDEDIEMAQFIVDACNEKEQRDADPLTPEEKRIIALGVDNAREV